MLWWLMIPCVLVLPAIMIRTVRTGWHVLFFTSAVWIYLHDEPAISLVFRGLMVFLFQFMILIILVIREKKEENKKYP